MKYITIVHGVGKIKGIHHIDLPDLPGMLLAEILMTPHTMIWVHVPEASRFYIYYWLLNEQGNLHNIELA
jgi:hypothetical protein